ncbi:MAG: LON peptidase substrate-binding domain-containing protein [Gammaproteobacteria bacterium]|nr:LON peptidase substrate-binding domain-containing protein [Gammaproteobacteria bacterium]MDE2022622.1 LON peptidase substrate-binding domain-containing protein [Gammaproteobacteria bacterium]MDE2140517.1 LON peptidase substrate-binding domain-containing protein [Gammaproteobacteria bacterium]
MPETLALFPLNTVLFPGGPLPLRIFETRYLDMLSRCLKSDAGFGVCLIEQGSETGRARTYTVGTLARVRDWSNDADGLLHILATGERRFRIVRMRAQHDGLYLGEVEWLPDESPLPLPESAQPLAELLRTLLAPMTERYATITEAYDDSSWVGYRLAELLPLPVKQRQHLLELSDAQLRLDVIAALVQSQAEPNSV